jgi:hypothetical protein
MKKQENKSSKKEDNPYQIIIKERAIKQLSKIPDLFQL